MYHSFSTKKIPGSGARTIIQGYRTFIGNEPQVYVELYRGCTVACSAAVYTEQRTKGTGKRAQYCVVQPYTRGNVQQVLAREQKNWRVVHAQYPKETPKEHHCTSG